MTGEGCGGVIVLVTKSWVAENCVWTAMENDAFLAGQITRLARGGGGRWVLKSVFCI